MLIRYCCILYLILYLLCVFNDLLTINSTNADIDRLTQVVQFPPKLNWSQFKSESVRPFFINASPALRVAESRNPDQLSRGGGHTLDRSPVHRRVTYRDKQPPMLCPRLRTVLESARCSRLWTVVGCWRNIQTPTSNGVEPVPLLLLWGHRIDHCATVLPSVLQGTL